MQPSDAEAPADKGESIPSERLQHAAKLTYSHENGRATWLQWCRMLAQLWLAEVALHFCLHWPWKHPVRELGAAFHFALVGASVMNVLATSNLWWRLLQLYRGAALVEKFRDETVFFDAAGFVWCKGEQQIAGPWTAIRSIRRTSKIPVSLHFRLWRLETTAGTFDIFQPGLTREFGFAAFAQRFRGAVGLPSTTRHSVNLSIYFWAAGIIALMHRAPETVLWLCIVGMWLGPYPEQDDFDGYPTPRSVLWTQKVAAMGDGWTLLGTLPCHEPGKVYNYQGSPLRILPWALFTPGLLFAISLMLPDQPGGSLEVVLIILTPCLVAGSLALGLYLANSYVVLDDDGITVRNLWIRRRLPWSQISTMQSSFGIIELFKASGEKVRFLRGLRRWRSLCRELQQHIPAAAGSVGTGAVGTDNRA